MKSVKIFILTFYFSQVLLPYFSGVKGKLGLPDSQKALIVWDAFKAHGCESVRKLLADNGVVTADVPKNLTHLLSTGASN